MFPLPLGSLFYTSFRLAEGHNHRSLGQRPRNTKHNAIFWPKAIITAGD